MWIGVLISGAILAQVSVLFFAFVIGKVFSDNSRDGASVVFDVIGFFIVLPLFLISLASFIIFTIVYLVKRKNLKEQEEILQFEKERIKNHDDNEKYRE